MELIEKKVSSLNEMFVAKIINGEYEIVEADRFTIVILIGGKYRFSLWIANDWDSFETNSFEDNFMKLDFSMEHKEELFKRFKEYSDNLTNEQLLQEKKRYLKEIEELELKLGK